MRITVLDCETTGLDERDELIELGMIQYERNGDGTLQEVSRYHGLREPGVPISEGARSKNGFTEDELQGKRLDDSLIRAMLRSSDAVIAHNAKFDRRFISKLYPADSRRPLWYCSCWNIDWKGYGFERRALTHIAERLGIDGAGKHRAVEDCEVLLKCLLQKRNGGAGTYLDELLACSELSVTEPEPTMTTTAPIAAEPDPLPRILRTFALIVAIFIVAVWLTIKLG